MDAKACVATQIRAINELVTSGDVKISGAVFPFVVGDEFDGNGMRRANEL